MVIDIYNIPLSHQVEEMVRQVLGDVNVEINKLDSRLSMASANARNAGEGLGAHSFALSDAHGIQEMILDVINAQMLDNSAFQLDEDFDGIPDKWSVYADSGFIMTQSMDSSVYQYGTHSLKLFFNNPTGEVRKGYLTQTIPKSKIVKGGANHSFSYYYYDSTPEDSTDFEHYVEVILRDSSGGEISRYTESPPKSNDDNIRNFTRWSEVYEVPENTNSIEFRMGIIVQAGFSGEAWIDYPMVNAGNITLKPGELVAGIIESDHIQADTIEARHITAEAIEAGHISADAIESKHIQADAIEAGHISADSIETKHIQADAIESHHILAGNIEATHIHAGAIDASHISANAIETRHLSADSVTAEKIKSGEIETRHISADGVSAGIITSGSIDTSLVTIRSANGTINIADELIQIKDGSNVVVALGKYEDGKYGIKAGETILNKDGLYINSGEIRLGKDLSGNPTFLVTNEGYLTSKRGTIANFTIHDNILQSNNSSLVLNSETSEITLSNDVDYETIVAPGGIFGKAPIARLSGFDATVAGSDYYITVKKVYSDTQIFHPDTDYAYNKVTGEIVKLKGSDMPSSVSVDYVLHDWRDDTEGSNEDITENVTFVARRRASAIITDDSLVDATFVKNLVVGSAEIGHASINTAHISEIHGNRIIAGTLDVSHIEVGRAGNLIPNSTFVSKEFYLGWEDLMLGSPSVPYNLLGDNFQWTEEEYLYDGASIKQSSPDSGISYIGLDVQIGVVLKPRTSYVFSAFQRLNVPSGESLDGYLLDIQGDAIDIEETSSPSSDNIPDKETHGWKRKAVKFRTGDSGYVRLLSVLREPSSEYVQGWVDGFMLEEGAVESAFYKSGITRIRGGNIETGSIGLSQLNFTPLNSKNVIASINASEEGLVIDTNKLAIQSELYGLRAEMRFETDRISSRVGMKATFKPKGATLFKFDGNLESTDGLVATLV